MEEENKSKPVIGLFPYVLNLGETIPLLNIANEYIKLGGEVVFFSHGGKYEHLIKDSGYKIIKLSDIWKDYTKTLRKMINNGVSPEKLILLPYKNENLRRLVKEEIEAFNKSRIKLLISSFILSNSISARVIKVPLVVVISGVSIPPYYATDSCTFPENYENFFTKMIPSFIKNRIFRWYLLNCKYLIKDFNKIAKEYHIPRFRNFNEILLGDHTFICDDINFLGLNPSEEFPRENFIGPIFRWSFFEEQKKKINSEIKNHLNRKGKSIFLSIGTSGDMQLFLKIIKALNKTDYNVIVVYSNILNEKQIPSTNENILFKKFVPSAEMLMKLVDLSIIHGGRGTVYTTAFSGKPAMGIPMFLEQQSNINNLVKHGAALKVSKRYFKEEKLLNAIDKIFSNYEFYLNNAQILAEKLTHENGAIKAAHRIIEIVKCN